MPDTKLLRLNIKSSIFLLIYICMSALMEYLLKKYVFVNDRVKDKTLCRMIVHLIQLPLFIIASPGFSNELFAKSVLIGGTLLIMAFNCYKLLKIDKRYAILCLILFSSFIISGYFILSILFY